jgi:hypothetical protein
MAGLVAAIHVPTALHEHEGRDARAGKFRSPR